MVMKQPRDPLARALKVEHIWTVIITALVWIIFVTLLIAIGAAATLLI